MNNHVMLDEETLDVEPGGVILSVGLVRFTPNIARVQTAEELGKGALKVVINLQESIDSGFTISASTLKWWMSQSKEAQASSFEGRSDTISDALLKINNFVKLGDHIWCNGANFDAPLLEKYYKKRSLNVPWKYNKVRCHRTIATMHKRSPNHPVPDNLLAHDPVADCIYQIQVLQSIAIENPNINWS